MTFGAKKTPGKNNLNIHSSFTSGQGKQRSIEFYGYLGNALGLLWFVFTHPLNKHAQKIDCELRKLTFNDADHVHSIFQVNVTKGLITVPLQHRQFYIGV